MQAFLSGVFFIVVLLTMHLWPQENKPWLVIFPNDSIRAENIQAILSSSGQIMDIHKNDRFIIQPGSENLRKRLLQNGAFLVLNATYEGGCGNGYDISRAPFIQ